MLERARPRLSPGESVSGLVVEELVGVGGFGSVYRARRKKGGGRYALKFIPLGWTADRALREFAVLLRVRHPNLVQVAGLGLWPEKKPEYLWLQLGFVEGERLDAWAKRLNPDARGVARRVLEVARGLVAAHAVGVVHRDVKEANIVVRASDGEAVLVDFGSGTYEEAPTLTQGPLLPGTPAYMSPEALRFASEEAARPGAHYRAGPADDMYALGVVLYRLCTGRRPFEVREPEDEEAVLEEEAVAPHLLNPRVPGALSAVCMRLLEKEPQARYASMAEVCTVLEGMLEVADASWRVPLLEPVTQSGGSAPWLQARGRALLRKVRRRAGWLAAVGGLAACLAAVAWLALSRGEDSRAAAVPESAPAPRQAPAEVAPALDAGRLPGALPSQAATPTGALPSAALPRKDDTMTKPPESEAKPLEATQRGSKKVAGCTAALLLAGACAGGPSLTRPPDDMACEAGSVEDMEKTFHIRPDKWGLGGVLGLDRYASEYVSIRDGDSVVLLTLENHKDLPRLSTLQGKVTLGAFKSKPAAYFRFTRATSADGRKKSKVCMCAIAPLHDGGKVEPGLSVSPVRRYYEDCGINN